MSRLSFRMAGGRTSACRVRLQRRQASRRDDPAPKPKPDPASKPKPKPSPSRRTARSPGSDLSVGYWQARAGNTRRTGDAADGQDQGRSARADHDRCRVAQARPRRRAMGYYQRVLAAHPERTTTRQYLARPSCRSATARAREQLAEISKRCGVSCEDYQLRPTRFQYERAAG